MSDDVTVVGGIDTVREVGMLAPGRVDEKHPKFHFFDAERLAKGDVIGHEVLLDIVRRGAGVTPADGNRFAFACLDLISEIQRRNRHRGLFARKVEKDCRHWIEVMTDAAASEYKAAQVEKGQDRIRRSSQHLLMIPTSNMSAEQRRSHDHNLQKAAGIAAALESEARREKRMAEALAGLRQRVQ